MEGPCHRPLSRARGSWKESPTWTSDRNRDFRAPRGCEVSGPQSRQATPSRPKKFLRNPLQCPPIPLSAGRWGKGMPANPLQGIQVINSVNPCSSTPLHRPIHPHHLPGAPSSRRRPILPSTPPSPGPSGPRRSTPPHPTRSPGI